MHVLVLSVEYGCMYVHVRAYVCTCTHTCTYVGIIYIQSTRTCILRTHMHLHIHVHTMYVCMHGMTCVDWWAGTIIPAILQEGKN